MAKNKLLPLCLFFIAGAHATAEEKEAAEALHGQFTVRMRNGQYANTPPVEACTVVAGTVPKLYEDAAFPLASAYEAGASEIAATEALTRAQGIANAGEKPPAKPAAKKAAAKPVWKGNA